MIGLNDKSGCFIEAFNDFPQALLGRVYKSVASSVVNISCADFDTFFYIRSSHFRQNSV
jgi:hypothetical protein